MGDDSLVTIEITARAAEEVCNVNVEMLHETLTKLPAEKYLKLFSIMYSEIVKTFPSSTLPHSKNF